MNTLNVTLTATRDQQPLATVEQRPYRHPGSADLRFRWFAPGDPMPYYSRDEAMAEWQARQARQRQADPLT